MEGVLRSLRHRVRRYPAVVVDGGERRSGVTDFAEIDKLVAERVADHARLSATGGAA
jgi:hypothetical protein